MVVAAKLRIGGIVDGSEEAVAGLRETARLAAGDVTQLAEVLGVLPGGVEEFRRPNATEVKGIGAEERSVLQRLQRQAACTAAGAALRVSRGHP